MSLLGLTAAVKNSDFKAALELLNQLDTTKPVEEYEQVLSELVGALGECTTATEPAAEFTAQAVRVLAALILSSSGPEQLKNYAGTVAKLLFAHINALENQPELQQSLWVLWLVDRVSVERALRDIGLVHPNAVARLLSLNELRRWVIEMRGRIAFRKFTLSVVRLLNDSEVKEPAFDLLVLYFKTAREAARLDLIEVLKTNEMLETEIGQKLVAEINKPMETVVLGAVDVSGSPSPSPPVKRKVQKVITMRPPQQQTPEVVSALSFQNDELYKMQPLPVVKNQPTPAQAFAELEQLAPNFEGKETETNWKQRQRAIYLLRLLVREEADAGVVRSALTLAKPLLSATAQSLRSMLVLETAQCVKDYVQKLSTDPQYLDLLTPIVLSLAKTATGIKKVVAHPANLAVLAYFANAPTVSEQAFKLIKQEAASTKANARSCAFRWLAVALVCCPPLQRPQEVADLVARALSDASPLGREAGRMLYGLVEQTEIIKLLPPTAARRVPSGTNSARRTSSSGSANRTSSSGSIGH